ncbi:hypothetical protein [Sinorhizobium fredii]|uniref:hypothetical protein n=1 Tax=Rhizobium fredii TaxID=380 RepID=UPI0004AF955F|nr:hypothetical protein [Sinorhizobium fredii]ASY73762.1 transposase [Sinorhizobium fredii CCBAU 83666]
MPVSVGGDTLLRMIRAAWVEPPEAHVRSASTTEAQRKGQHCVTIIRDLERNRVLDLLPDRNA